jgi:hypothetical protein
MLLSRISGLVHNAGLSPVFCMMPGFLSGSVAQMQHPPKVGVGSVR